MRTRSIALPALTLAVSIFLVSCTSGGQEANVPTPPASQSTTASETSLPHSGAPKVQNPLPASVLSGDPCVDPLTSQQVADAFGAEVPAGKPNSLPTGPICDWANLQTGGQLGVAYKTMSRQGLSALYQNTQPQTDLWKELPLIEGFPAVAYRGAGNIEHLCTVSVGLADEMAADISVILGRNRINTGDPCAAAANVAKTAVTNLRDKAGS